MQPGSDPFGPPSSFTSRKQAASNLPVFELPPPPLAALHSKYQPLGGVNSTQPTATSGSVASVGNLLTPPNTIPGEGGSPASANSSGSSSSQGSVPPFTQPQSTGYWVQGQPNASQYASYQQGSNTQWIPPRGMFSASSIDSMVRHNSHPTEMLPSQPFEMNQLPPFTTAPPPSLPTMAAAQQQQSLHTAMMNAQNSIPSSATHISPVNPQEPFGARPPPTPTYFPQTHPSPTNAQMNYAYSNGAQNGMTSPVSSVSSHSRMSPNGSTDLTQQMSASHPYQRPFTQFSLPAMNGPVMSNLHNPSQMPLVSGYPNTLMAGFSGGYGGNMHSMYGMHPSAQHHPHNDRPFKCDQCVQSFNRNHDLKRHKRIHLAVKPYPCGHCEKSFSRKDALKRHILVKGCGKTRSSSDSPDMKDGSMSPGGDEDSYSGGHGSRG